MHFTSLISLFKIGIPAITIVALLVSGFHASNFGTSVQQFMPYGSSAVLKATTTAGIIFSLNAFQTIINIGNDLQKSYVNMKRAINISLGISVVIYILLQLAFIGAIDPNMLAKVGWSGIDFSSPFADLATLLGLYWLSVLLYLDAFVSPFGTGVSTVASSGRALAAMVSNDHLPKFIGAINERYHVPRTAMLFNVAVSLVMVTFFRSWGTLATVISSLMLIAYLTGPISVVAFRKMGPEFARPIKIRLVKATSIVAFALVSLAIYWAMWPTTLEVVAIILVGLPIYFVYEWKTGWANTRNQVRGSLWMICYLVVLIALSWVGSRDFNGLGLIPYPLDQLVVVLVSLVFYHWGTNSHLFTKYFQRAKRLNDRKVRIPHRHRVEAAERRHREETSEAAN